MKLLKMVFLSLIICSSIIYAAKPQYCQEALLQCWESCNQTILVQACQTGCNIGYLMCGN